MIQSEERFDAITFDCSSPIVWCESVYGQLYWTNQALRNLFCIFGCWFLRKLQLIGEGETLQRFLEQLTQIFGRNFLSLTKILLWTWSDYLKVNSPLKNLASGSSSPGNWPRCFYRWLLDCSLIAMQVVKVSIVVIVVVLVILAILVLTMVRALILPVKILPESLVPL